MKIFDTILFWNEIDLLELRLNEHYNYVDQFVIVESDYTFTGIKKEYVLEKNIDRFNKWIDKINYIKVTNPPNTGNPWENEFWQRGQFYKGWNSLEPSDVIIISDIDEIIRPQALEYIRHTNFDVYILNMAMCYFKFNYMRSDYMWNTTKAFRGISDHGESLRRMENFSGKTVKWLEHAGWHFTWLTDSDETIIKKIESFSHSELNNKEFIEKIDFKKSIGENKNHLNENMITVKLDEYFPKTILDNQEKYQNFVLPNSDISAFNFYSRTPHEIMCNFNY